MTDKLGAEAIARHAARRAAVAFLCIFGLTSGLAAQNRIERATATFGGTNYVVQAGDLLRVRIWGWPDPTSQTEGSFPVEPSGLVYLPVIGALQVAGKTSADVQDEFRKRFAQEQRNPVVTVQAVFAVSVMGEVGQPGVVDVEPGYTVFDAISLGGGYSDRANRKTVLIVRKGNNIQVTGASAEETAVKLASMLLESGDRVIVQRNNSQKWSVMLTVVQTLVAAASLVILVTR